MEQKYTLCELGQTDEHSRRGGRRIANTLVKLTNEFTAEENLGDSGLPSDFFQRCLVISTIF